MPRHHGFPFREPETRGALRPLGRVGIRVDGFSVGGICPPAGLALIFNFHSLKLFQAFALKNVLKSRADFQPPEANAKFEAMLFLLVSDARCKSKVQITHGHFQRFSGLGNDLSHRKIMRLAVIIFGFQREDDLDIAFVEYLGRKRAAFAGGQAQASFVMIGEGNLAEGAVIRVGCRRRYSRRFLFRHRFMATGREQSRQKNHDRRSCLCDSHGTSLAGIKPI